MYCSYLIIKISPFKVHAMRQLNSLIPSEKKLSDFGEISNTFCADCTLGYHAHQLLKSDVLWLVCYNGGYKCPTGHSCVQK